MNSYALSAALIMAFVIVSPVSQAADICTATALRDIAGAGYSMKKGDIDDAITQYNIDKKTGETTFCSHGGGCYPTHVTVGGDKLEALKLDNCAIDRSHPYEDDTEISYGLLPIRSQIPADQLREDDLDNQFLALGLCSACASNVAHLYLKKPKSKCATVARAALEGSPEAMSELDSFPDYCKAW